MPKLSREVFSTLYTARYRAVLGVNRVSSRKHWEQRTHGPHDRVGLFATQLRNELARVLANVEHPAYTEARRMIEPSYWMGVDMPKVPWQEDQSDMTLSPDIALECYLQSLQSVVEQMDSVNTVAAEIVADVSSLAQELNHV